MRLVQGLFGVRYLSTPSRRQQVRTFMLELTPSQLVCVVDIDLVIVEGAWAAGFAEGSARGDRNLLFVVFLLTQKGG